MGPVKLIVAAFRRIIRFPLVQLIIVVAIILFLQGADEASLFGRIFTGLDRLVESTISIISATVTVRAFTRSWLTFTFMIAYVYLACLLILWVLRLVIIGLVYLVAWSNAFGLRSVIARERGIAAYRAWLPFERIRPSEISQREWEETYAWPADNSPPYPSLPRRILTGIAGYGVLIGITLVILQVFTPLTAVTWLRAAVESLTSAFQSR
ncbi:MAG: hypothetical protein JO328_16265 [Hyphomicrobiales bacterium]|nr:hypothetical protein [Hyphomicrobiales bacterium]MBV9426429.1 hypothetical protein [Bradyrhizobiaceae bacterium]